MPRTFKVHSCIGRGGFGEVYRATLFDGDREEPVALKILHAGLDPKSLAVQRLRDESRMLQTLDHPHILKAQELAVLDGRVALVTEIIEGADLRNMAEHQPLPRGPALELIHGIADALYIAQTHEVDGKPLDLVHRDVKPENVRIGHDGQFRLLDFGVARTEGLEREAKTDTDVVMGSLPYIAPEVLTTHGSHHGSDVYALGATLFYALQGERLFPETGRDLFTLLLNSERFAERLEERAALIDDPGIADLVRSMSSLDPDARPTFAEIRRTIDGLRNPDDVALARWCDDKVWPPPKSLPGVLSGRVMEEERIDPSAITGTGSQVRRPVDPEVQNVTQVGWNDEEETVPDDRLMPRLETPASIAKGDTPGFTPAIPVTLSPKAEPAPETPGPALQAKPPEPPSILESPAPVRVPAPVTQTGPTRTQLAVAATGIGLLMLVGFLGAFSLGLLMLGR